MCRLLNNLNSRGENAWNSDEGVISREHFSTLPDSFSSEALEAAYQLIKICNRRTLQPKEITQDQDPDHSNYKNMEMLKRKSPYILKRQLHINKPRRPFILK
ncbi:NEUT protein, partial [Polyodon spathula]|nr:NEUT protein [Polyodon spathula]